MKKLLIPLLVLGSIASLSANAQIQDSMPSDTLFQQMRPFMRHSAGNGEVSLVLRSIYLFDGLMWLSFDAHNHSAFDFKVDWLVFTIRQRHRVKRTAIQDIRVRPIFQMQPPIILSDSSALMSYALIPRVLGKDKQLLVEFRERNGDRQIRLILKQKELLKARKLLSNHS
jgi:Domain of unknown function (DUF4138)